MRKVLKSPFLTIRKTLPFVLFSLFITQATALNAAKPIEDFGLLPNIRSVVISPDGKYVALIKNDGKQEYLNVRNLATKKLVGGLKLGNIKARSLSFPNNDTVIMKGSDTVRVVGYRGKINLSGSYAYSISKNKVVVLLNKSENLHPAQTGVGKIVGFNSQQNRFLMPAFSPQPDSLYNLYSVSLKTGLGRKYKRGSKHTVDWFVNSNGSVIAREDYNNKKQLHRIYSYTGKTQSPELIYEEETPQINITIDAVSRDERSLIFIQNGDIQTMNLADGAINTTTLANSEHGIDHFKTDLNRKLVGVTYKGLQSFTELIDPDIAHAYKRIEQQFKDSEVSYQGSTKDGKQIIVRVSGNDAAGDYFIFENDKSNLIRIGSEYPSFNKQDIAAITAVSYEARDGLKIPSVLTWPASIQAEQVKPNLPLIVFPHGGPQAHDGILFDWWAQYFAAQGYLVLQPNFRGSSGFGFKHLTKGDGEWGKAMQDDVSDGVLTLVEQGYVDPERVCIVGAAYGGYSALAGGAFSPALYRCVIAVAGVSDLPRMLNDEKKEYGSSHWVIRYWQKLIGNSKTEREKLNKVSPANFANQFSAPTLLIHGKDDTIVPITQSRIMYKALKKAKKDVTLIELKGEDHWLSSSKTRLEMLKAIDKFLKKHNPT